MPVLPEVGSMMTELGRHAALLRVLDHGQRHAVLHGTGRVEVLELCQNAGLELLLFFDMGQLQKGVFRSAGQRMYRSYS